MSWSDAVERGSNSAEWWACASTYEGGVVNVGQDGVLRDNVIDLSQFNDVSLLQTLHGKVVACLLVFGEHYSSKRAYSKR